MRVISNILAVIIVAYLIWDSSLSNETLKIISISLFILDSVLAYRINNHNMKMEDISDKLQDLIYRMELKNTYIKELQIYVCNLKEENNTLRGRKEE